MSVKINIQIPQMREVETNKFNHNNFKHSGSKLLPSSFKNTPTILGVCLIKNEQNFIAWALMNALDFCDEILILDNMSEDSTLDVVTRIKNSFKHIEVIQVRNCNNSHKYVEKFAGSPIWVLKIDGDEILDPIGLMEFRKELKMGDFNEFWELSSSMLHVVGMDFEQAEAFGFNLARQGTVLYNFNAIDSWHEFRSERLHGGNKVFRSGYSESQIHKTLHWSGSKFRTLHMCFMPRSPIDTLDLKKYELDGRKNPLEKQLFKRVKRSIFKNYYRNRPSFKNSKYTEGKFEVVDITNFGRPDDFRMFNPECDYVMNMIRYITNNRRHIAANYRR